MLNRILATIFIASLIGLVVSGINLIRCNYVHKANKEMIDKVFQHKNGTYRTDWQTSHNSKLLGEFKFEKAVWQWHKWTFKQFFPTAEEN